VEDSNEIKRALAEYRNTLKKATKEGRVSTQRACRVAICRLNEKLRVIEKGKAQ
jgi:hypothetical protein